MKSLYIEPIDTLLMTALLGVLQITLKAVLAFIIFLIVPVPTLANVSEASESDAASVQASTMPKIALCEAGEPA